MNQMFSIQTKIRKANGFDVQVEKRHNQQTCSDSKNIKIQTYIEIMIAEKTAQIKSRKQKKTGKKDIG